MVAEMADPRRMPSFASSASSATPKATSKRPDDLDLRQSARDPASWSRAKPMPAAIAEPSGMVGFQALPQPRRPGRVVRYPQQTGKSAPMPEKTFAHVLRQADFAN
jgi:hypothetical protein